MFFNRAANRFRLALLSARHRRMAGAVAVRRAAEMLCRARPGFVLPHPVELVVAVESACQLKCSMCGIRKVMKRPEFFGRRITRADLLPALTEASKWRPRPYLKLTGGEPLLLGDGLLEMLDDAGRLGLASRLSTNGVLLSDAALARALVKTGVDAVTISLDGPRDVHNAIRGRDFAFDRAALGIKNLFLARKSLGSAGPLIMVSTVVSAANHHRLIELFGILKELPIDWWNVQLINYVSEKARDEADAVSKSFGFEPGAWDAFVNEPVTQVNPESLAEQLRAVAGARKNFVLSFLDAGGFSPRSLKAYYGGSEIAVSPRFCTVPYLAMHVVPSGDMVFCIDYPHVSYGNIKTHGLKDAWKSETARKYRRYLEECRRLTGSNPPQCQRCNWLYN